MARDPLGFLDDEILGLRAANLFRDPASSTCADGLLNLCSNDYLGYARARWHAEGVSGAGASRLVGGTQRDHEEAEAALAAWVKAPAALLFSSGYAANVSLLPALAGAGDLIVSDALNHASIIDGCRLSRAAVAVVPHANVEAVALALQTPARRRFVVTESLFSMEGDVSDLVALRRCCDDADAALVVDEAHALGVAGPEGAGACAAVGVRADVMVGTCGKALGLQGAFVAGDERLRAFLWNRARGFVFSTGVAPMLASAIRDRVAKVRSDDDARARLSAVGRALRAAAQTVGIGLGGVGPILPWVLGEERNALAAASQLREAGVLVHAIRPPTVPAGLSRLRLTASAALTEAELALACQALRRVGERFHVERFT